MHKKCAAILIELQKEGSVELWSEFQFAPKQPLIKRLKDILEPSVDEKYYLSHKLIKGLSEKDGAFNGRFEPKNSNDIAVCLTARYHKMGATDNYIKVIGKLDCKGDDYIKRVS